MSWSVGAIGKTPAVRAQIANEFARNPCSEPEESVRQSAAATIDAALAAQDANIGVNVYANGSQSFKDYAAQTGVSNNLSITIEPIWGFVE